jgi:hypothetical protein
MLDWKREEGGWKRENKNDKACMGRGRNDDEKG